MRTDQCSSRGRGTSRRLAVSAATVLVLSAVHFCAAFFLFAVGFARGMHLFDHPEDASWLDHLLQRAMPIAWFPAWQIAQAADVHQNALEWILLLANSLVWGAAMFAILVAIYRLRNPAPQQT